MIQSHLKYRVIGFVCLAALTVYVLTHGLAQAEVELTVNAPKQAQVGAAWTIDVALTSRNEAGESIGVVLFNGLNQHTQTLITGTGGIARWEIPAGVITQAGESLIVARYGDSQEVRRIVRIVPGLADQSDLVTTGNTLRAYGDGRATVIALLRDAYGNPARASSEAVITLTYPGGESTDYTLAHETGLAWTWFSSLGEPGRVRVQVNADSTSASIELRQSPGEPEHITLTISPDCAPSDGRDVIRLSAGAFDGHGAPVVDGTLIRFEIGQGFAYAHTWEGVAVLSIPAPTSQGLHRFIAASEDTQSPAQWLRITDEVCP